MIDISDPISDERLSSQNQVLFGGFFLRHNVTFVDFKNENFWFVTRTMASY